MIQQNQQTYGHWYHDIAEKIPSIDAEIEDCQRCLGMIRSGDRLSLMKSGRSIETRDYLVYMDMLTNLKIALTRSKNLVPAMDENPTLNTEYVFEK